VRLLKRKNSTLETEKEVQKTEYNLLKKEKENFAEQLERLQKEHKNLERDFAHSKMQIQGIGNGSKEIAIILHDLNDCLARIKEDYSEDLDYLSKQVQESHIAKLKVIEECKKLTLEMKQVKEKLQSQMSPQNVQGRLLDELRTVTDMLNAALVEKNNLDIQNINLKQNIQALEKKLTEYEELTTIVVDNDPCPVKGPLFQLLINLLFLKRETKTNQNGVFPIEPPVQLITTPIPEITSNITNITITNTSVPSNDVGTPSTVTTTITTSNPFELSVLFASPRNAEENSIPLKPIKLQKMMEIL